MIWFMLYLAPLLFLCIKRRSAGGNANRFYVCDRRASDGAAAFSLLASCIGGSATLGMIGLAWQAGTPAFWWLGSGVIGLVVLGALLARKVRAARARTLPELCQRRLGSAFRLLCALLIGVAYIPVIAAQFNAQALLINSLTGLEFSVSLILGAAIVTGYAALGGQQAVIKSDVWQFAILCAALLALLYFCLSQPAGRHALAATPLAPVNDAFPPSRLLYYLLVLGGSFVVGPMLYGRILSSRSQRGARRACFLAAAGLLMAALVITAIGLALQGIMPPASIGPDAMPQDVCGLFIKTRLPEWAAVLCLLGLFSAVVSSADSCIFTAASIWAVDILKKPSASACRKAMLALVASSVLLALSGKGILDLLLMANDIYVCGVAPPVFLALLGNGRARPDKTLLIAAVLLGGTGGACAAWSKAPMLSVAALLASTLLTLAAIRRSAVTGAAAPAPRKAKNFFLGA